MKNHGKPSRSQAEDKLFSLNANGIWFRLGTNILKKEIEIFHNENLSIHSMSD